MYSIVLNHNSVIFIQVLEVRLLGSRGLETLIKEFLQDSHEVLWCYSREITDILCNV